MSWVGSSDTHAPGAVGGSSVPEYNPAAVHKRVVAVQNDPLWVHVLASYPDRMIAPYLVNLYDMYSKGANHVLVGPRIVKAKFDGVPVFSADEVVGIPPWAPRIIDRLFFANEDERRNWWAEQHNQHAAVVRKVAIQNTTAIAARQTPEMAREISEVEAQLGPVFGKGPTYMFEREIDAPGAGDPTYYNRRY